jgi:hypothetical protein
MVADSFDQDRPGLFGRVRELLLQPRAAWERIARETSESSPLRSHVAPLAVLGAVAGFAAHLIYRGVKLDGALAWSGVAALIYVVSAIAGVALAGAVIAWLAPRFGADVQGGRASRLAAYAATPILISAFGAIAPPVAGLITLAGVVYALIELGIGASALAPMRTPDSAPRFVLLFAAAALAIIAVLAMILAPLAGMARERVLDMFEAPAAAAPRAEPRSSLVARTLAVVAQTYGARIAADPVRLQEQFPDSLPGAYALASTAGERAETLSRAHAVYQAGDARLRITLLQLTPAIDVQALAAELAINEGAAPEEGYARTQAIDGRLFAEEASADAGRYVVIGRGVVIVAEGAVTVDEARAAVETLGLRRLEHHFGR